MGGGRGEYRALNHKVFDHEIFIRGQALCAMGYAKSAKICNKSSAL